MQGRRQWGLIACALAAGGCARVAHPPAPRPPLPSGRVSYHAGAAHHVRHYAVRRDVSWSQPRQSPHNAAPAYPPALLGRHLPPTTVAALLIVDTRGRVTDVRFPTEPAPDETMRVFRASVRRATSQWTFTPPERSTWKTMADGMQVRIADQAMPFSQTYAFRFAVHDGRPVVVAADPRR